MYRHIVESHDFFKKNIASVFDISDDGNSVRISQSLLGREIRKLGLWCHWAKSILWSI